MTSDEIDGRCLIDQSALKESLDRLVELGGFRSRSSLTRVAGLSPGMLNPSKMGGQRSLTVRTLLKLCAVAGISIVDWALIYQSIAAEKAPADTPPEDAASDDFDGTWDEYSAAVRTQMFTMLQVPP